MAAECLAAFRTFPFIFFRPNELFNAMYLNEQEIFNHTHSEKGFIALVEVVKIIAGEILTFIAVFYLSIQERRTFLFDEGTLSISWPAAGAVGHSNSLASHIMFKGEIPAAYCAVHAAGGNQLFIHYSLNYHSKW